MEVAMQIDIWSESVPSKRNIRWKKTKTKHNRTNKNKQTKKNQRGTMSAAFGEIFLHAYGKIQ